MQPKLGFIGFGEAAFNIVKGLKGEGLDSISAYDKFWNIAPQSELVQKRAQEAGATLATSLQDLIENADIVVSAVSANLVVPLAKESAPFLKSGQIYVDLNSAGPDTKVAANEIISPHALFVDVAVMGTVPGNGHKVPMLAAGAGAALFVEKMKPYGMNLTLLDGPAGKASASKMFRSIFMKGFVTLLLEAVVAGHKYGIEDDVLASIEETLTAGPLLPIINGLLTRGVIHSERREHEMDEVIATLKSLQVDSTMSEATKAKLRWCTDLKFKEHFKGVPPKDFHEIFTVLEK
jgi:3-hydroxyisobutyrate dehydrogenase-like beta-hydroxyacid dehydrogenase